MDQPGTPEGVGDIKLEAEYVLADPEEIVAIVEAEGVKKLGTMEFQDYIVRKAFNGSLLMTLGSEIGEDLDWETTWTHRLDNIQRKSNRMAAEAGWNEIVEVEAQLMCIRNGAGPPGTGILQAVLVRWQKGKTPISAFGLPAVQAIINYKWETWAKHALLAEFMVYLLWLATFITFAYSFRREDLSTECAHWENHIHKEEALGQVPRVSIIAANFFMLPFLIVELNTIITYKMSWLTQYWNMIDMATYTLTVLSLVVYLTRWGVCKVWFSILLGIQCVCMVAKIQYFSRVFATSKGSMGEFMVVILSDVRWFLMMMFFTLVSFGIAFYIINQHDRALAESDPETHTIDPAFQSLWNSIVAMFCFMLGGFDVKLFYMGTNEIISVAVFLLFESVMAVMLLNLLIAVMTDVYSKIKQQEDLWIASSKAQIIDELESTLPSWITKRWNPLYLHILTVGPPKDVNVDSLWSRVGLTGEKLVGATEEATSNLRRSRKEMLNILQKFSERIDTM